MTNQMEMSALKRKKCILKFNDFEVILPVSSDLVSSLAQKMLKELEKLEQLYTLGDQKVM